MGKNDYKQWEKSLEDFQKSVEKDLAEIRRQKEEIQQIKAEIVNQLNTGQYLRDNNRIIISAPEIIIGNVDKGGMLFSHVPSKVVIRSNQIALDGAGDCGSITNRATSIRNISVDPGSDGQEEVVTPNSEYLVQARNIALTSNEAMGSFPERVAKDSSGISLHADKQIQIEAALPCETRKENLEDRIKSLKAQKDSFKKQADKQKKEVGNVVKELEKLFKENKALNEDEQATRTNFVDIDQLTPSIKSLSTSLYQSFEGCVGTLSALAETNRQIKDLEEEKKRIDKYKGDYKKKSTDAFIELRAETTNIFSVDGDGNIRTNSGAGVNVNARSVNLQTQEKDGSLIANSSINLSSQNISLSTINPKIEKDSADFPAVGNVSISSKNISLAAVDYTLKDNKAEEKALTEKGSISMRAETIEASTNNTEGEATGSITLNSKELSFKAMDVDKEKRTDKQLTAGSSLTMVAEKMYAGSLNKDTQSQSVQIVSDKVGVFAKTTAEMQQGEGKAIVQLDGGNVNASGAKTAIFGETTMNGKTAFKDEATFGKATINNMEVKTSFKTPCTTEGFAVPDSPSTAQLSAKLKEEDAPKNEKK